MMNDMFKQGPMTEYEAEQLARRYREQGKKPVITGAFDAKADSTGKDYYVFTDLPVSVNAPVPSRKFQNKMWSES
jgi:hypothetical protein